MRGKRGSRIAIALASVLCTIAAATPWASLGAQPRYTERSREIVPGMTLRRITDSVGPNRIKVLEMVPSSELTTDVELANDTIPGHETTSSMATRNGAIAAINGDFTMLPSDPWAGRPVHLFAEDGRLVASPLLYGRNFAISYDEQETHFTHPQWDATITQQDSGEVWDVAAWNEPPEIDEFPVFTPEGGNLFRPLRDACSARFRAAGSQTWKPGELGIDQSFVVEAVQCSETRLRRRGGLVVSAPIGSAQALAIEALLVGETVTIGWSAGWRGVLDTIGGNPTLIRNGRVSGLACEGSYFCDRNPRTVVGRRPDGTLLLVTVDGRQPDRSVGMTLPELAELMQYLEADWALNLDGGGSTTMWVNGRVVNRPSGPERPVGSALLVLPGPDPSEVTPLPPTQTTTAALPIPTSSEPTSSSRPADTSRCEVLRDPGSTGGLFDALVSNPLVSNVFAPDASFARGSGHGSRRASRAIQRVVDTFRGERACGIMGGQVLGRL